MSSGLDMNSTKNTLIYLIKSLRKLSTMSYRKIWEQTYGKIPPGHEIHHIDGNRKNNDITNLLCLSTKEHYEIHLRQGDYMACNIISLRVNLTDEEKKEIHKKAMAKREQSGKKNPMYGRSAIAENNMKWYTNGEVCKMYTEGKQPEGWTRGRVNVTGNYGDRSGSNNSRSKKVIIEGVLYDCLKTVWEEKYSYIPYSSIKGLAQGHKSKKWKLDIRYA